MICFLHFARGSDGSAAQNLGPWDRGNGSFVNR
jgi:hypothetical protein